MIIKLWKLSSDFRTYFYSYIYQISGGLNLIHVRKLEIWEHRILSAPQFTIRVARVFIYVCTKINFNGATLEFNNNFWLSGFTTS